MREAYEDIYQEMIKWRPGRALLCLGRLNIHHSIAQKKIALALMVAEENLAISDEFVLCSTTELTELVREALSQKKYHVAYRLIRDAEDKYGGQVDRARVVLLEARLLWKHLGDKDGARSVVKVLIVDEKYRKREDVTSLANELGIV